MGVLCIYIYEVIRRGCKEREVTTEREVTIERLQVAAADEAMG